MMKRKHLRRFLLAAGRQQCHGRARRANSPLWHRMVTKARVAQQ
jgi:hypothetical protein